MSEFATASDTPCSTCGSPLQRGDRFCGRCGVAVSVDPSTRPTRSSPPTGGVLQAGPRVDRRQEKSFSGRALAAISAVLAIGVLLGFGLASVLSGSSQHAMLCQDALTRRRQAEDALARSTGTSSNYLAYLASEAAEEHLRVAREDVQRLC
jgi:hypothetical protein